MRYSLSRTDSLLRHPFAEVGSSVTGAMLGKHMQCDSLLCKFWTRRHHVAEHRVPEASEVQAIQRLCTGSANQQSIILFGKKVYWVTPTLHTRASRVVEFQHRMQ